MNGWEELGKTALNIGAQIYQGQVQKRDDRRAARSARDFPQLGMGLAATGPQRTPGGSGIGAWGPGGFFGYQSSEGGDATMDQSVAVMRGSRFPTQLIVYTTPSGTMHVGGYRSIGQPLLWSSDLAAVRRVARVARKLGRFIHHRRPR